MAQSHGWGSQGKEWARQAKSLGTLTIGQFARLLWTMGGSLVVLHLAWATQGRGLLSVRETDKTHG